MALNLALALVASSNVPLVLLDGDLNVIAASGSFCRAFQIASSKVVGRLLGIGEGEWATPQLIALLKAAAAGYAEIEAYEMDLKRTGKEPRRLVLNVQKLDYADQEHVRLLLTVSDVTDARVAERVKNDLVREKAILMDELQHRVANSLQIIASVLMQSAKRVNSEETRTHLIDAHHRVLSVATLQTQLAASTQGNVELRSYFTGLCESLGASMIQDHKQISLEVSADETVTTANISMSLGLMITELVINALKHAFPNHRKGRIVVDYYALNGNWTLSVRDSGIGIHKDLKNAIPGLGTSIVRALAKQLQAHIAIGDANPGTIVSVTHTAPEMADGVVREPVPEPAI